MLPFLLPAGKEVTKKMRINNHSIFKPRAKRLYRIENKAKADESTVYIYDEIGWFGIMPEQFVKDFNAITSPIIHVRINSPGGDVFDGTAIYNVIKQHKSKVIVHVDGLAASISSIIAMAGDEVRMSENAFMMIHNPYGFVFGTAQDMRERADLLDKITGTIAKTYMNKTGKDEKEIKKLMGSDTWMTAQESIDNGFIDVIEEEDEITDKSQVIMFDLSAYANVPDALKDQESNPSKRDIEAILTKNGVSQKQAKAILAEGYKEGDQRDADSPDVQRDAEPSTVTDPPVKDQRDADPNTASSNAQRDADPLPEKKDKLADLLERAEAMAPTNPKEKVQEKDSQGLFLHINQKEE